jgi:hypothetical protein
MRLRYYLLIGALIGAIPAMIACSFIGGYVWVIRNT